jgi:hypothetical protein
MPGLRQRRGRTEAVVVLRGHIQEKRLRCVTTVFPRESRASVQYSPAAIKKQGVPPWPKMRPARPSQGLAPSPKISKNRSATAPIELYEERGKADGHDLDDWLRAEEEITQQKAGTVAA